MENVFFSFLLLFIGGILSLVVHEVGHGLGFIICGFSISEIHLPFLTIHFDIGGDGKSFSFEKNRNINKVFIVPLCKEDCSWERHRDKVGISLLLGPLFSLVSMIALVLLHDKDPIVFGLELWNGIIFIKCFGQSRDYVGDVIAAYKFWSNRQFAEFYLKKWSNQ